MKCDGEDGEDGEGGKATVRHIEERCWKLRGSHSHLDREGGGREAD
jgi:hypothetical protein